jgi:hypothetical protein
VQPAGRLAGTGFVSGATVTLGGVAVLIGGTNSTSIVFTAPAHGAGPVDIVVIKSGGKTVTLASGYTYGRWRSR